MKLAPIFALIAIASPGFAQAPPCDGGYEFFSGKSTTEVLSGNTLPDADRVAQAYNNREGWIGQIIRKPQSEGLHEVTVGQCGRRFVLTQGGNQMVFLQSDVDETLYVAQDIGTEKAELTVRVVDHKIMVGRIAGQTHGFGFNFPVAMEPREIAAPDMEGCKDETPPGEKQADAAKTAAAQGLVGALALQRKTPAPGYALADYVLAGKDDHGRQNSWLHLGATGSILPAEPLEPGLERICAGDGGPLLDPPRLRLNFKQREVEGEVFVFVQVIDIETGVILEQREAVAASPSAADRAQAMSAAWSRLDTPVGTPGDGYSGG